MKKSCPGKKGHHEQVNVSVILLPLRPASPTLKNLQRRKIIHGIRPVGSKAIFFTIILSRGIVVLNSSHG